MICCWLDYPPTPVSFVFYHVVFEDAHIFVEMSASEHCEGDEHFRLSRPALEEPLPKRYVRVYFLIVTEPIDAPLHSIYFPIYKDKILTCLIQMPKVKSNPSLFLNMVLLRVEFRFTESTRHGPHPLPIKPRPSQSIVDTTCSIGSNLIDTVKSSGRVVMCFANKSTAFAISSIAFTTNHSFSNRCEALFIA